MAIPAKIAPEIKTAVLAEYNQHPNMSRAQLAYEILNKHSFEYTIDYMRQLVSLVLADAVRQHEVEFENNIISLPETWYEEISDYVIPKDVKKIGIINDVHVPFHAPTALKIAIEHIEKNNVDMLVLNGDIADFYAVSRFTKMSKYRNLSKEIEVVQQFLDYLRSKFDNIIYKFGNHEARLDAYVQSQVPELGEIGGLSIHEVLGLSVRNIKWIEHKVPIRFGKLTILHGDEIAAGGQINTARNKLLAAFDNVLYGHHHATQDVFQRKINDEIVGSFGVGCLCGLKPYYATNNRWNYGFAIVERDDDGYFEVKNLKIINNKVI